MDISGQKRNEDNSNNQYNDLALIITTVFFLLLNINMFSNGALLGTFGVAVVEFFLGVFGFAAYPITVCGLLICFYKLSKAEAKINRKHLVSYIIMFISGLFTVHLFTTGSLHESLGYTDYIVECFLRPQIGFSSTTGGGILIASLIYPIARALSSVGAYILSIAVFIVATLIALEDVLKKFRSNKIKKMKIKDVRDYPITDDELEVDDYDVDGANDNEDDEEPSIIEEEVLQDDKIKRIKLKKNNIIANDEDDPVSEVAEVERMNNFFNKNKNNFNKNNDDNANNNGMNNSHNPLRRTLYIENLDGKNEFSTKSKREMKKQSDIEHDIINHQSNFGMEQTPQQLTAHERLLGRKKKNNNKNSNGSYVNSYQNGKSKTNVFTKEYLMRPLDWEEYYPQVVDSEKKRSNFKEGTVANNRPAMIVHDQNATQKNNIDNYNSNFNKMNDVKNNAHQNTPNNMGQSPHYNYYDNVTPLSVPLQNIGSRYDSGFNHDYKPKSNMYEVNEYDNNSNKNNLKQVNIDNEEFQNKDYYEQKRRRQETDEREDKIYEDQMRIRKEKLRLQEERIIAEKEATLKREEEELRARNRFIDENKNSNNNSPKIQEKNISKVENINNNNQNYSSGHINDFDDEQPRTEPYVEKPLNPRVPSNKMYTTENDELQKTFVEKFKKSNQNNSEDTNPIESVDEPTDVVFKKDMTYVDINGNKIKKPKRHIKYNAPPINLLSSFREESVSNDRLQERGKKLLAVLADFNIQAEIADIVKGPTVSRFELIMPRGVKVKKITDISDDIAMRLESTGGIRIMTPIPGKDLVGIEIPNETRETVWLRDIIDNSEFKNSKSNRTIAVGKDVTGNNVIIDFKSIPHMLVAGSTGMGKSVFLNTFIISLLYKASPEDLKLILIDPKRVEFSSYNGLPHMLLPKAITDVDKSLSALNWAVNEMDRRFTIMENLRCKNIDEYREKFDPQIHERLPNIIIIIDEFNELMMKSKNEVEEKIIRLSQLARASGIQLVLATQRPTVDVISGTIKSNIITRIAFKCISSKDSQTILDHSGAEQMLGKGDMLASIDKGALKRIQGAYIDNSEVDNIVEYIKENNEAFYDEAVSNVILSEKEITPMGSTNVSDKELDDLYDALGIMLQYSKASTTFLQRKMGIGYSKAARFMDSLETMGYIIIADDNNCTKKLNITQEEYDEIMRNRKK